MSSAAHSPAFPPEPPKAERYNFLPDLSCPRCFRGGGSLSRLAVDGGLYRCVGGCEARFRREPANDVQADTLVRILWTEAEWNAGARIADDVVKVRRYDNGYEPIDARPGYSADGRPLKGAP